MNDKLSQMFVMPYFLQHILFRVMIRVVLWIYQKSPWLEKKGGEKEDLYFEIFIEDVGCIFWNIYKCWHTNVLFYSTYNL